MRMRLGRHARSLMAAGSIGACVAALAASGARAAPAAGGGATTQSQGTEAAATVGDIVVQAERRSEVLRDVPAAVTVVTGATLASIGPIVDTSDLINAVPGARFTNLGNPLQSEISIRGSGTERATGADTSVGLYVGGAYVGSSSDGGRVFAPIDSFDVDHIEVLEGPQGALYGRDAEYGVINIIPQQPTFSNSGYVNELYDFSIDQNQETGVVNYKVNDNWAVRLGARGIQQWGGFEYNPDTHKYYDRTDGYMLRGQARYRSDKLDVSLLAERQDLQVPSFWSADNIPAANPATGFPGIATVPLGFFQNPRVIPHNGVDYSNEIVDNVMLQADYDLGWARLHSTSSWREVDTIDDIDSDYSDVAEEIAVQTLGERGSYPFAASNRNESTTTWYEDLHLAGAPVLDRRVTWLAGVELMDQPYDSTSIGMDNPCASSSNPLMPVGKGACTGTPSNPVCVPLLPGSTCPAVVSPYGSDAKVNGDYFSWAPYGSVSANLPAGFRLEGAVRYSHDRKTAYENVLTLYTGLPYPFKTGGTIQPTNYLFNKGQWTWAVTLSYKLPGPWNDMIYGKVGTGYRVGGFNFGHTPPLVQPPLPAGIHPNVFYAPVVPSYGDETSTSYEIGFKGDVTPRVFFTLDAYWETTQNALAAVGDGCLATNQCEAGNTNYTVNAGQVNGSGVEASLNTAFDVAGGHATLEVDGSNQYGKYVSEPKVGANGQPLVGLPLVGTPVGENPNWVANATLNYTHPFTNDTKGFFNVLYHGQWGGIQDPITTAGVFFPLQDYQDLDLRTGIDVKQLELALVIHNLTGETHRIAEFYAPGRNTLTGQALAIPEQQRLSLPRTISLEATYKW